MSSDSKPGFFARLRARLTRPGAGLGSELARLFGARRIDAEVLEELETRLLAADVGVTVTQELLEGLRARVARQQLGDVAALLEALQADITALLRPVAQPLRIDPSRKPFTILVVGVNGSGKTTTIGKLANLYTQEGLKVMLAAGDTFRAAATEQLGIWASRTGAELIAQAPGADPAAVAFDALSAARSRGADVLIADTAGRLQAQTHLMEELRKVRRVLGKVDPSAPHEVLLVLDDVALSGRLDVARQSLATARTELRQYEQLSLTEPKARASLAAARGTVDERQAEVTYLEDQLGRTRLKAARAGTVLLDDPTGWAGRPITTGERLMRIADPDAKKEIEVWVSLGDAIPIEDGADVKLYLSARPLDPISARVRYYSHQSSRLPDGTYGYRVRATPIGEVDQRLGLKGTARISASWTPLGYWVFRRPLAAVREFLGL